MDKSDQYEEQAIRERAYFIWEREGRPKGRAKDHWMRAVVERSHEPKQPDDDHQQDEEKILAGRSDVNYPALLTKDVPGG